MSATKEEKNKTRSIGIDLGTTHVVLATAEGDDSPTLLEVPQLIAHGVVEPRTLLPAFLYFAAESEGPMALPWDASRSFAVGTFARSRGAEAAHRLIASAKSWLCHPGIDRRGGVLPLEASSASAADGAADIERISPVEASFRYLDHLADAYRLSEGDRPLADEAIVLTVPASFDAIARELTVEAATVAGFENLTLLEEPQAALYAWIAGRGDAFRKDLHIGDVILVVDIGGGTTDFSAIVVGENQGELELRRIAVGDHILLGGDNMDLALGHLCRERLRAEGTDVDGTPLSAWVHAARDAKERLLGDEALVEAPVTVLGRGASLLSNRLKTVLTQADIEQIIVDGFFPKVDGQAKPKVRARAALREFGLPYADDPAVTRHLAAFLQKQRGALGGDSALLIPTAILWNGGVLKSDRIRRRLHEVLASWATAIGAPPPRVLEGADLDHAVAKGAAHYGRLKARGGLRIRGGTAQAYYVGIEASVPAIPGMSPPIEPICVAPIGMEEGSSASLPALVLGVIVGEPVLFRFFVSTERRDDRVGTRLPNERGLIELPEIEVIVPTEGRAEGEMVAVTLSSQITEVGTLLLEVIPVTPRAADERFKVEFSIRAE